MMILGQCMSKWDGNLYYSPASPRGGEAATFAVEVTHVHDAPTLVVTVQHRNEDETSWADRGAFDPITAVGIYTKDLTGLKELVRFKYTFTSADAVDAVRIIVPAPSWRPY